jgi:serine/threonine-protein kinase PpkA
VYPEIPGYKIVQLIGEGAMASVFLGVDEKLDRKVAIKVMSESLAHDPTFRDRFLAEARDTAKFVHPGIVTIHATDVYQDKYYLILEYLEAGTLKQQQKARRQHAEESGLSTDQLFSVPESLNILAQVADALAYAHSKKVVHRDIKPANIMFRSDGTVVLTDFGIAKSVTENRELTMTGYSVGTPAYMSPEQRIGASDIDSRSDLYSLGIVFFELLSGRKPFKTQTGNYADLRKELDGDVPKLPESAAHLQPLLDRMLAPNPDDRYQTASSLLRDCEQFSEHKSGVPSDATVIQRPGSSPVSPIPAAQPATRPRTLIFGAIAAVMVVIAAAIGWQFIPESAPEVMPVDAETAARFFNDTATTEIYTDSDDWIYSSSANAAFNYVRMLKAQPGNPDALEGLRLVHEKVLASIQSKVASGNLEDAGIEIQLALEYFPEDSELLDLQKELE